VCGQIGPSPHSNLKSNHQGRLRSQIVLGNIPAFKLNEGRNLYKQKPRTKTESNHEKRTKLKNPKDKMSVIKRNENSLKNKKRTKQQVINMVVATQYE
jgi:hypothetical protein